MKVYGILPGGSSYHDGPRTLLGECWRMNRTMRIAVLRFGRGCREVLPRWKAAIGR